MIRFVCGSIDTVCGWTMSDLKELSTHVRTNTIWRFTTDVALPAEPRHPTNVVYGMVAIAAPSGQVAVWCGPMITATTSYDSYDIAASLTGDRGFAYYWIASDGPRSRRPIAEAAGRLLHARAFGNACEPRDEYLAEWAQVTSSLRPPTRHLLSASDDALAAASAMLLVGDERGAVTLLRDARAQARAAARVIKPRKKRTQISGALYAALTAAKEGVS